MFRKCLREWLPLLLGLLGVAVASLIPWYQSRVAFPDEPFDVSIIYRDAPAGDIQYLPLIRQLSDGSLSDGTVKEFEGRYLRLFPHATLAVHAACFAAFGESGFPVADVLVSSCYFLLLVFLFRSLGASRTTSALAACCLALPVPLFFSVKASIGPLTNTMPLISDVWGSRIPRPFVSELCLIAVLATLIRLLAASETRVSHWVWLAAASGLLINGDLHAALTFALISPGVIAYVGRREGLRPTCWKVFCAGVLFLLVIAPFAVQRLSGHPDIPVRWGLFEMDRLAGFKMFWQEMTDPALIILVVCLTAFVTCTVQNSSANEEVTDVPLRRTWLFLAALIFVAFACKPISILILGKTIQPYQFIDRAQRISSYVVLGCVSLWIDMLFRHFSRWCAGRGATEGILRFASGGAVMASFLLLFGFRVLIAEKAPKYTAPIRQYYYSHAIGIQPTYREAFAELTGYLGKHVPGDAVVGSFDHQVFAWWMTFHDGYWFLVEPFVSSIPDDELETRVALFCKLLGMSAQDYIEFIQPPDNSTPQFKPYVDIFWLGQAKYQASQLYTYRPLEDYTPQQRDAIQSSTYSWHVIIPQSELVRHRQRFENLTMEDFESRALDVIVLCNAGPEAKWAPPEPSWELKFQNDGFRVYSKMK